MDVKMLENLKNKTKEELIEYIIKIKKELDETRDELDSALFRKYKCICGKKLSIDEICECDLCEECCTSRKCYEYKIDEFYDCVQCKKGFWLDEKINQYCEEHCDDCCRKDEHCKDEYE